MHFQSERTYIGFGMARCFKWCFKVWIIHSKQRLLKQNFKYLIYTSQQKSPSLLNTGFFSWLCNTITRDLQLLHTAINPKLTDSVNSIVPSFWWLNCQQLFWSVLILILKIYSTNNFVVITNLKIYIGDS